MRLVVSIIITVDHELPAATIVIFIIILLSLHAGTVGTAASHPIDVVKVLLCTLTCHALH